MLGYGARGLADLILTRRPAAQDTPGATRNPPHDPANLVEVDDLRVHFPVYSGLLMRRRGSVRAVDGLTLDIRRGETVGVVGESGCGKSTLGRALIRLLEPTSGTVRFDGVDLMRLRGAGLRRFRRRMQMVFQDPYGSLDPRMTVGSIIGEPIGAHGLARGDAARRRVEELMLLVGLDPAYARRYPHEFSGGQRQRIGIARALATEPEFIVCDEPISALDVSIRAQILNLLTDLRSQLALTYVFVAHDLAVIRYISDRVAVMYLGRIVEIGRPADVYEQPRHPYTLALLSAVPTPHSRRAHRGGRLILDGELPSPADPPTGCRFHTRCWLYKRLGAPEECRRMEPPLTAVTASHAVACHHSGEVVGYHPGGDGAPSSATGRASGAARSGLPTLRRRGCPGRPHSRR